MKKHDNITLLIHGPISIYTIFSLYKFAEHFDVVVCCPRYTKSIDDSIWKELERLSNSKTHNVSLFVYGGVEKKEYNNQQNRFFHFFSVSLGLQACKTDYVIKLRSDEFYSDLNPFISTMIENSGKITTNDVFFRNSRIPFHPSDHLVGGKVSLMKKMFELAKTFCEKPEIADNNIFIKTTLKKMEDRFVPAEVYLGAALMTHLYPDDILPKEIDVTEFMQHGFVIVPSEELGVIRVVANSLGEGKEFFDTSYRNPDTDITDIEEYK